MLVWLAQEDIHNFLTQGRPFTQPVPLSWYSQLIHSIDRDNTKISLQYPSSWCKFFFLYNSCGPYIYPWVLWAHHLCSSPLRLFLFSGFVDKRFLFDHLSLLIKYGGVFGFFCFVLMELSASKLSLTPKSCGENFKLLRIFLNRLHIETTTNYWVPTNQPFHLRRTLSC